MSHKDPRLVFLKRAAARLILVEAGEISLDDALPGMACPTCGAWPCVNPSFCAACWKPDARRRERSNVVPAIHPTPAATIEAVMHAVRERGIGALKEPATAERLARCDAEARAEINRQIEKPELQL